MKKIWAAFLAAFLIVFLAPSAGASTIRSIEIVAEVQSDGSVIITDTRTFDATEGTEHYVSIENLGESDIRDFSVVLNGQSLTDVGDWDVDRSREAKAGQSGVVTLGDGYELAFGFGEYGTHTAVMTYTITNFVYNLDDGAQAVYWEFIPRNMTPTDSVAISLTNSIGFQFTQDASRVWGFGYEGSTEITPGALTMTTAEPISASNYMTMLAIFPDAPFSSSVNLPETSDSLEEMAKEGSIWEDGSEPWHGDGQPWDESDSQSVHGGVIAGIVLAVVGGLGGLGFMGVRGHRKRENAARAQGLFKLSATPTVGREDYWREVPYDGLIADIFKVSGEALPHLATALLLQWVREGALREVSHEAGWIFKREESAFELVHRPTLRTEIDTTYWDFIIRAAREDGVLQRKEIEQFTRRTTIEVSDWQDNAAGHSEAYLRAHGFMQNFETKTLGIFPRTEQRLTSSGMELKNRIEGFKNYLRDFSLLNERGASNVMLWDQYMIWAGYLGIAEEVAKQFNIVDPSYDQSTSLTDSAIITGYYFSTSMQRSYSSATSSSGGSGGGGMSSIGGGGGSFGGGGGGGGIR